MTFSLQRPDSDLTFQVLLVGHYASDFASTESSSWKKQKLLSSVNLLTVCTSYYYIVVKYVLGIISVSKNLGGENSQGTAAI